MEYHSCAHSNTTLEHHARIHTQTPTLEHRYMARTLDLKVHASAVSQSQNQVDFEELHFEMELPKLTVENDLPNSAVEVSFKNPLSEKLTNVKLRVSDDYGDRSVKIVDVAANANVSERVIVPQGRKVGCVYVSVVCDNLFTLPWVQCSCEGA